MERVKYYSLNFLDGNRESIELCSVTYNDDGTINHVIWKALKKWNERWEIETTCISADDQYVENIIAWGDEIDEETFEGINDDIEFYKGVLDEDHRLYVETQKTAIEKLDLCVKKRLKNSQKQK